LCQKPNLIPEFYAEIPHNEVATVAKTQKWVSFLTLSMTGGIIYQVAYIRYVYLDATYTALHISGQQYGDIIAIFGTVATVMYFFGGWFADRFSPKLLIIASLVGTGVADVYLASVPGYWGILSAHILMAVMGMGLYWAALVKAIGMFGGAAEQGRLFGFLEGTRGLTSTVIGFIGTAIVAKAVEPQDGVLGLIRIYGILCFVFAAAVLLLVKEDKEGLANLGKSTVTLTQLWAAAKNKYTWLIGGTIFMMYSFYTTLAYFTPLLQTKFGMSVALLGIIGVTRTYVFMFVAGPTGGFGVDKLTHSAPKFLRWMFIATVAIAAIFLVMPKNDSFVWVALVLMFVLSFAVFASRGVYWATVGEVEIPAEERGGIIGLASGLGYLPDAFLPALAAWWIGDPTASPAVPEHGGGYSALFIFLIVGGLLGIVLTTVSTRVHKADLAKVKEQPKDLQTAGV
jgi:MFS family permease